MWDRPYALPTFLRMLVQAMLVASLVLAGFSTLVLLAIIVLGVSMIIDPRDRPLDERPPLDAPTQGLPAVDAPEPPAAPDRSAEPVD